MKRYTKLSIQRASNDTRHMSIEQNARGDIKITIEGTTIIIQDFESQETVYELTAHICDPVGRN